MASGSIFLSSRYMLAYMGFFATMVVYFCRINLSIAIVKMVGKEDKDSSNSSICPVTDLDNDDDDSEELDDPGDFDWTNGQRGDLLGCYYYGYILTQIVGAWLSSRMGFKTILGWCILIAAIITPVTPVLANAGYIWIFVARVVIGLLHGVTFPLMHGAWSAWAPPLERSNLVSIYVNGNSVGTCLIFPIGGLLAGSLGWESVFYFTGGCGVLWSIAWYFLVFDTPAQHPRISVEERDYIETSIAQYQQTSLEKSPTSSDTSVPWKGILTSKVLWAVAIAHLASNWGIYQMNSLLPTYLSDVLHFNIEDNGFISALPFIAQSLLTFFAGWLCDFIRQKGWMKTGSVRKLMNATGLLIPGVTVVLAGYAGCEAVYAILLLTISVGFTAFTVPGAKAAMLDFAPKYAGILFAISNTVANLSGFLAPITTGRILDNENSLGSWQLAFWISGIIYIPGFIAFQIFGTDQIQSWAH